MTDAVVTDAVVTDAVVTDAAVPGQLPAGQLSVGDQVALTDTAVGQTAVGQTAVGETAVGETAVGPAVRGEAEPAPAAGVPHIALVVRDTVASADWWCRTFGFVSTEQPNQAGGPDRPASPATPRKVVVRHPDSGLVLGFRQRARDSGRGRFEYLSLRVASERALGDWAAHLHRLGIPHSSVRDTGDEQYLSLTAPDGIGLELWWSRPRRTGSRPRDTAGVP
ncbi:MAG: glyoxylase family protein [Pseudonocardiales bacterium]|nr:glyoxylase family protein [Pseudonocardiales bacterium]